jgi:hypothetical protein
VEEEMIFKKIKTSATYAKSITQQNFPLLSISLSLSVTNFFSNSLPNGFWD